MKYESECGVCCTVAAKIEEWDKKEGHDSCHYYPDIFRAIAQLVGAKLTNDHQKLPPKYELQAGCRRYQDELYAVASDETWLDHLVEDLNKIARRTLGGSFPASAKRDVRDAIKKHLNCGGG